MVAFTNCVVLNFACVASSAISHDIVVLMAAFLLPGVLGYNLSNGLATVARAGGASCLLTILQSVMFLDIIHKAASLHAYELTLVS